MIRYLVQNPVWGKIFRTRNPKLLVLLLQKKLYFLVYPDFSIIFSPDFKT
jgi:hypothetical protein